MRQKLFPVILLLLGLSGVGVLAQDANTTGQPLISLAVPGFSVDAMQNAVTDFEAQYGVKVLLIDENSPGYRVDTETYLDDIAEYAARADVLIVEDNTISVEATRAGYLLDMMPLVQSDAMLDSGDFYATAWQSYQWDGGMWAVSLSTDATGFLYNATAFDEAGLFYPDAFWSVFELENAARALATYNDGTVEEAGVNITGTGLQALMMSLSGSGVFDPTFAGSSPVFDAAVFGETLDTLTMLYNEGLISNQGGGRIALNTPLSIASASFLAFADDLAFAPLPNGRAGMDGMGAAISSGTQNPELAYQLVAYLTQSPDVLSALNGTLSARYSLAGVEGDTDNQGGGPGGRGGFGGGLDEETLPIVQQSIESAFPISEMLFGNYLSSALNSMRNDGLDAQTALQDVEIAALDGLAIADARRGTFDITITNIDPDAIVATGTVINFGISNNFPNLPNEAQWNDIAAQFVADNADIGAVNLASAFGRQGVDAETLTTDYDCFYSVSNLLPDVDLTLLLPLDPFMSADPNFDVNDLAGNTLQQMQNAGQTWGLPLHIQAQALWYDAQTFELNGAWLPYAGWTPADFETALRSLKINPDDAAPFVSRDFDGTYLLTLIAAYGGLPLDYSTDPVTVNFGDEATLNAAMQVLDLARDGYIDYSSLGTLGGGGRAAAANADVEVAMYSQIQQDNAQFGRGQNNQNNTDDATDYQLVTFPQGETYTALSYDVGAAYISINSQNADACYRFISTLLDSPDLFTGMPAQRSLIDDPAVLAAQGQAAVDYYRELDRLMQQPNAVIFPTATGNRGFAATDNLVSFWLYRVFDTYVTEDGTDLEAELRDAQQYATEYQTCVADIVPDPEAQGFAAFAEYIDCAVRVDPTMADILPGGGN
ncbi:MAG: hypothetical protein ACPG7F_02025 [Aggregatilineales bacterium]